MAYVAGVDSSTQSCKVVVCDADSGVVIRTGRASHPSGTEVTATAWWAAFQEATREPGLLDDVVAMSVGGQQHGMVTLDEAGEPVRDALLWNDNRSAPDAIDLIDELGGPQAWADAVGTVPVASITATKVRWLARSEPENLARTALVLLPHDYLTWEIGGRSFEPVTDRGDASGTGYFDSTSNTYRTDLMKLACGREFAVPRVARPDEIVGHTPAGIALAPGTGDNMAAGLGLGAQPGTAIVSLGTSGTAFTRSLQQTHEPTGTVAGFADAAGAFLPLVCTLNGARNMVAAARVLGVDVGRFAELALAASAGSEGVGFMPYLEGERTPPLPLAQGQLTGLTLANMTPENLARATIEGVLWSLAYGVQVLREQTGSIERIVLTGGAAQSRAVQQIAPAVFGVPVVITAPMESVAIGAARQAAWAHTGHEPDWPVDIIEQRDPTSADIAAAREIDARYRSILTDHYLRPSTLRA